MNYNAFEQAAAEASSAVKELDTQLEQLRAQSEQLKGKRDLLDTLSRQLSTIRPAGTPATPSYSPVESAPQAPASREVSAPPAGGDIEAEMAAAAASSARSFRDEWLTGSNGHSKAPSGDSSIRSRL